MNKVALFVLLTVLTACGNVPAADKKNDIAEQKSPPPEKLSSSICLSRDTKPEKIACFELLAIQGQKELAESQAALDAEIERGKKLDKSIKTIEEEIAIELGAKPPKR